VLLACYQANWRAYSGASTRHDSISEATLPLATKGSLDFTEDRPPEDIEELEGRDITNLKSKGILDT